MPLNDQDARALTYLVRRLRDETHGANAWDEAGVHAVLTKLIGRNLPLTVEQITRHACDPKAKTPGAIMRPFLPNAPTAERSHPPRPADECRRHPGQYAGACGGCHADRQAARDQADAQGGRSTRETALAAARAALADATADLCAHHLHPDTCRLCRATTSPARAETKEPTDA